MQCSPPVVYLMLVSAAAGQLSAASTTDTKQQYGGCNPQEVKVCGGYGAHEVNVLRAPPAGCKSTAGVTCSKLRLVLVKPAGGTDFLWGALEPHTRCRAARRGPTHRFYRVPLLKVSRSGKYSQNRKMVWHFYGKTKTAITSSKNQFRPQF